MNSIGIINSKSATPLNKGAVSRPGLENHIFEIVSKKAAIISAPAGFGKTTLVSTSIDRLGKDIVWYTTDEYDKNFDLFFSYIIQGFKKIYPDFGAKLLSKAASGIQEKSKFIYNLAAEIEESLENDPMQIISGRVDRPVVHFEAPPADKVPMEIKRFIELEADMDDLDQTVATISS
ncbi:MAG: hypothetical protein H6680_11050 [Desulfobacteraceae bacterium]|nr:hypothetical protein [Desulfobacteraceae bacterium]